MIMVSIITFQLYIICVHTSYLFRGGLFHPGKMTVSSVSGLLQITVLIM